MKLGPANRYWKWIQNYVADDYTGAVKNGEGMRCPFSNFFKESIWMGKGVPGFLSLCVLRPTLMAGVKTTAALEKYAVMQSPSQLESLVKIFVHATKVLCIPFHSSFLP